MPLSLQINMTPLLVFNADNPLSAKLTIFVWERHHALIDQLTK